VRGAEILTAFDYPRIVIPEIDIWRAANLMIKRYGDKALEESAARADELAAQDDHNGTVVWRRIADAVGQLANNTQPYQTRGRSTLPFRKNSAP
jgi:hypothetical protein